MDDSELIKDLATLDAESARDAAQARIMKPVTILVVLIIIVLAVMLCGCVDVPQCWHGGESCPVAGDWGFV